MNKISLGHRSFGFGAAAQVYYGKEVKELTLAQIAVLAGLPKAPSTLNPISRPDRALKRRAVVLQRMYVAGYITSEQLSAANQEPVTAVKHGAEIELSAPYIAEMAHQEMVDRFGKEAAYTGGYKVFTTVTSKLQAAAQEAVVNNIFAYDQRHGYRGPLATIRPADEMVTTAMASDNTQIKPITANETIEALSSFDSYHSIVPAVVTQVMEQSAKVRLQDGSEVNIDWQGLAWARAYINDDKQAAPPSLAKEILTTGDIVMVSAVESGNRLSQLPEVSAALVSLATDNGAIKAAVGGFSFNQSQFNRVTQAKRQVGSNIKPFIYSAALENGYNLASIVNDAPINQWDRSSGVVWRPKNSPPVYNGEIRFRLALAQSKNVIAVRLLREVGLDKIIPYLATFGFNPNDLPRNESLALGSASLTPLEVATGFATFANGGFLIKPYLIERIEDSFGKVLFQANPTIACDNCDEPIDKVSESSNAPLNSEDIFNLNTSDSFDDLALATPPINKAPRIISAQNAFLITEALNSAIWGADWNIKPFWQGTGFRARVLKRRDIAGKTGTTNEAKDAWFSGYSRRIVTTSWIGFDNPSRNLGQSSYNSNLSKDQTTGKEFGAKSAQPTWINFMKVALTEFPVEPFEQPEALMSVRIDKASGKLTTKTDKSSRFEYFELGTAPTEYIRQDISSEILDGEDAVINVEDSIFD